MNSHQPEPPGAMQIAIIGPEGLLVGTLPLSAVEPHQVIRVWAIQPAPAVLDHAQEPVADPVPALIARKVWEHPRGGRVYALNTEVAEGAVLAMGSQSHQVVAPRKEARQETLWSGFEHFFLGGVPTELKHLEQPWADLIYREDEAVPPTTYWASDYKGIYPY